MEKNQQSPFEPTIKNGKPPLSRKYFCSLLVDSQGQPTASNPEIGDGSHMQAHEITISNGKIRFAKMQGAAILQLVEL